MSNGHKRPPACCSGTAQWSLNTFRHWVLPLCVHRWVPCSSTHNTPSNCLSPKRKGKRLVSGWFSGNIGPISNGIQPDDDIQPCAQRAWPLLPQQHGNHQSPVSEVFVFCEVQFWLCGLSILRPLTVYRHNVPFHCHSDQGDRQREVVSSSLQTVRSQSAVPGSCKFCTAVP